MTNTSTPHLIVKAVFKTYLLFFLLATSIFTACKKTTQEPKPLPVVLNPIPGFKFTLSPTDPLVFTFEDTSKNAVGRYWDFGDGNVTMVDKSATKTITHDYNNAYKAGEYTKGFDVKLVVVNSKGVKDSVTTSIATSIPRAQASFVIIPPSFEGLDRNPSKYTFESQLQNNVVKYSWDFGDGTTITPMSAQPKIAHTYTTKGPHLVKLSVTDKHGNIVTSESQSVRPTIVTGIVIEQVHLIEMPHKDENGNTYDDKGRYEAPDLGLRVSVDNGSGDLKDWNKVYDYKDSKIFQDTYEATWSGLSIKLNALPNDISSNYAFTFLDEDIGSVAPIVSLEWSASEMLNAYYPNTYVVKKQDYAPIREGSLIVGLDIKYITEQ